MKTINPRKAFLILGSILLVWATIMVGCKDKKETEIPTPPENTTPLFAYKVNGKLFTAALADSYADTTLKQGKRIIRVIATNSANTDGITLEFENKAVGSYMLNTNVGGIITNQAFYSKFTAPDTTFESVSGTVNISKYDLATKQLSGTFSFSAKKLFSSQAASKIITEGIITNIDLAKP